jgi:predicted RNA-binding Zn-ribbon protein involved in translation (DUF1610 family)
VKHGSAFKKPLPDILTRDLVEECFSRLRKEWNPATPTQDFFVLELARHEATLAQIQEMEQAIVRSAARTTPNTAFGGSEGADIDDMVLAGAATADALEKVARYRRPHERAYLKILSALREAKEKAPSPVSESLQSEKAIFSSEQECEAYLIARITGEEFQCPRCGNAIGTWLASRKTWNCRSCKRQTGIRAATVMERSRLPLLAWFRMIEALLVDPAARTEQLASVTGIRRPGTIRRNAAKIRVAMKTSGQRPGLAGLDKVFGVPVDDHAAPSDPKK